MKLKFVLIFTILVLLHATVAHYWHQPAYNNWHRPAVNYVHQPQQQCQQQPCARASCPLSSCNNKCPVAPPRPVCPPAPYQPPCPARYPCPAPIRCNPCAPIMPCPPPPVCPTAPPTTLAPPCTTVAPQDCSNETTTVTINIEKELQICIKSQYLRQIFQVLNSDYQVYYTFSSVGLKQFNIQYLSQTYVKLYKEFIDMLVQNYKLDLLLATGNKATGKCMNEELSKDKVKLDKIKIGLEKQVVEFSGLWFKSMEKNEKCKPNNKLPSQLCPSQKKWMELQSHLLNKEINNEITQQVQTKDIFNQGTVKLNLRDYCENDPFENVLLETFENSKYTAEVKNIETSTEKIKIDIKIEQILQKLDKFCIKAITGEKFDENKLNLKIKTWNKEQFIEEITSLKIIYKNSLKVNQDLYLKLSGKKSLEICKTFDIYKLQSEIAVVKSEIFVLKIQVLYLNAKLHEINQKNDKECVKLPNNANMVKGIKYMKSQKLVMQKNPKLTPKMVGNKKYYLSTAMLTWNQARQECMEDKLHLASIETEDKFQLLKSAFPEVKNSSNPDIRYWVGASQLIVGEDDFIWDLTQAPVNNGTWTKNNQIKNDDRLCVLIGRFNKTSSLEWRKVSCNLKKHFVCE